MLRGYLGFLALVWAGIGLVLLVMPEALEGYAGVRAESGVAKALLVWLSVALWKNAGSFRFRAISYVRTYA